MEKNKRILIFGGAGFIGLSLTNQLIDNRYNNLFIADINSPKILPEGVKYLKCDITSEDEIKQVFKVSKPNIVYNLAGFANLDNAIKYPKITMELNVIGNINLLDASVENDVDLFIYASSAYAMSDKGSFYGISKLTSEKIIEEYNKKYKLNYAILRYGSIYAAADFDNNYLYQLVRSAIESGTIIHSGDGNEIREYIHVKDVSSLSVKVMEKNTYWNSSLMLTGNEKMKRKELFEMIREILGNDELDIKYINQNYNNHYRSTPYSFQGTSAKKLIANPHFDMGQGILDCIKNIMNLKETQTENESNY